MEFFYKFPDAGVEKIHRIKKNIWSHLFWRCAERRGNLWSSSISCHHLLGQPLLLFRRWRSVPTAGPAGWERRERPRI